MSESPSEHPPTPRDRPSQAPLLPAVHPGLPADPILRRALAAILRNREAGFHFPGNFLRLSFDQVHRAGSRVSLAVGPHNSGPDGQADSATLGVLADLGIATCIRAEVVDEVRLATVSMQLQLFPAPHGTRLEAHSVFEGFVPGVAGRQAVGRVVIRGSGGELVGLGIGGFMVLDLPAGVRVPPMRPATPGEPALLPDPQHGLDPHEQAIYQRAERVLGAPGAGAGSFIRHFWGITTRKTVAGATGRLEATPHVGNRVGHVQGGVLFGFAEETARAALGAPQAWTPTSISASYLRPGEPPAVRAEATTVHQGRTTAAVRVRLFNHDKRQVLEALLAYAAH